LFTEDEKGLNWLFHVDLNNRYFIRGYKEFSIDDSSIYTDFLPYTEQIVSSSTDIFLMPKIPPPKPITGDQGIILKEA